VYRLLDGLLLLASILIILALVYGAKSFDWSTRITILMIACSLGLSSFVVSLFVFADAAARAAIHHQLQ
jgi:hypothetical protein